MEKWLVAAKKADFNEWSRKYNIDPVLARIIRNRDVIEETDVEKFLQGTMEDCYSPWELYDMDRGVTLMQGQMQSHRHIRVIGDYDVDGICSSYILTRGLEALGAEVDTAIPHRMKDGYGLNEHLILEAYEAGIGCIITCDNGIAAKEQVMQAKELGMCMVVTDHHEVPFEEIEGIRHEILPAADAVIDPKQEKCQYPFKNICGAVVAYKFIQAICERLEFARAEALLQELLPFAALATVCDVMELKDENRIIVKEGLKLMSQTTNHGLRALFEVNELEPTKVSAYHLGFVIGPCLNATGRLDTALRALELLQSKNKAEAMVAATELKELNDSRKNLTLQGVEEAQRQIQELRLYEDKVMVVYLPQVHESLAGIIAGRIREKYHHPVFVLTDGEEGIKGSGRSIDAYHMYDSMVAVKEHFSKFGGHKLAAGLTLSGRDVEAFRRALNENARLTEEDFIPRVHIDVPMPMEYAGFSLAKELALLEPFGVGNPKPLFAQKDVLIIGARRIGATGSYAKLVVEMQGDGYETTGDLMFFGDVEALCSFLDEKYGAGSAKSLFEGKGRYRLSVTYQIGINSYRGRESLQFIMQNYC
ncbi:MAG: single-stranded-DNA-specific exonuclease RecJ [Lachnospiraceae bacterium]|nr:single-stranded-DNA-specific exonuclease RecJ [Lachnospiraceae bacterium]MBQ7777068.1 single-stranded-DNA-specific exonuclease RecJ [Lachnospiraceae bacterium]